MMLIKSEILQTRGFAGTVGTLTGLCRPESLPHPDVLRAHSRLSTAAPPWLIGGEKSSFSSIITLPDTLLLEREMERNAAFAVIIHISKQLCCDLQELPW